MKPKPSEPLINFIKRCDLNPETTGEPLDYFTENYPTFVRTLYDKGNFTAHLFQDCYGDRCVLIDGNPHSLLYSEEEFDSLENYLNLKNNSSK